MRANLINRVKREFDWDAYVKEHHTVKYTPSDELRICCVNCDDSKFKLYVNPVKGVFHCFKCNFTSKNYDVFDFVSASEGITRHQALMRLLREYARVTPDDDEFEEQLKSSLGEETPHTVIAGIKTISKLPDGLEPLTRCDEQSSRFWNYLKERGLTDREILAICVHYTKENSLPVLDSNGKRRGDLANRIVIPVYGGSHELVSWQARHIDKDYNQGDKYLSCPESELNKTLWPYVKPYTSHAVLVEGIFDCLAVRRIPEVSAYATFTKKISIHQMLRLKAWGVEEITLFWDRRDAKKEMLRAIPDLHMHFRKVYVCNMTNWPKELDAGNMLADPQGADKLKETLQDRVDTYDTLEFAKWKLSF